MADFILTWTYYSPAASRVFWSRAAFFHLRDSPSANCCASTKMDWEIGNYAFGAAPGHPFLKAVIENCVKAQKDPSWVKPMMLGSPPLLRPEYVVLNTTGPGLISRTLAENAELARMVTILFPDDVCDLRNWNRFGDLGVHLMDGTWRTRSNFVHRRLAQYWELWKLHKCLKQSRRLGKTRQQVPSAEFGENGECYT